MCWLWNRHSTECKGIEEIVSPQHATKSTKSIWFQWFQLLITAFLWSLGRLVNASLPRSTKVALQELHIRHQKRCRRRCRPSMDLLSRATRSKWTFGRRRHLRVASEMHREHRQGWQTNHGRDSVRWQKMARINNIGPYRYDWCATFSFPGIDSLPFVSFGSEKERRVIRNCRLTTGTFLGNHISPLKLGGICLFTGWYLFGKFRSCQVCNTAWPPSQAKDAVQLTKQARCW